METLTPTAQFGPDRWVSGAALQSIWERPAPEGAALLADLARFSTGLRVLSDELRAR